EENVEQTELYYYTEDTGELKHIPAEKWKDQTLSDLHWCGEGHDKIRFIRRDRLQRNEELCEYDPATDKVTVLITESVENAYIERQPTRYVGEHNTGDIVWWSERTGWGHYYLYSHDGVLKNALTSGPWRAENVNAIDAKKKKLYFSAVGREPGENLYNTHDYSVGLDGKGIKLLDSEDADHSWQMPKSNDYAVDAYSRVDLVPKTVLRDESGKVVMDLETMDLSELEATGWRMPERFVVKSADGVTDIFGNMWKPFDFDPHKKYPIILNVYPGPQTEAVSQTFTPTSSLQELAQLGFIVIQIGNRGGTPQRSNAYHSYGYYNLRDYGLADKKAGVEQLALEHPWIDIDRVGIFGHSGGGFMTAAAMLLPPYSEFFKVGVSSSGNHDNNIYNQNWSEQHHGLKVVTDDSGQQGGGRAGGRRGGRGGGGGDDEYLLPDPDNPFASFDAFLQQKQQNQEEQQGQKDEKDQKKEKFEIHVPTTVELAANLKGKLLLTTGDIDNNVHPGNTIRLVNALINANKRFDFMIMPGQRHGYGPMSGYFNNMLKEYFCTHLLGDDYSGSSDEKDKGEGR
ncbi:MAG TPA: prolyl oligopeptidase family serine peptidase, partial [Fimbriimonadaceae bacterium]|nr:prolyl oligopeptidase family serine peptidase [Fimbriimonadaceae bacterium]